MRQTSLLELITGLAGHVCTLVGNDQHITHTGYCTVISVNKRQTEPVANHAAAVTKYSWI